MFYSLQHHEWTVACQAPLSMGFPRQEYWSGLSFPPPRDFPDLGIKPTSLMSSALAGGFFTTSLVQVWNCKQSNYLTKPKRVNSLCTVSWKLKQQFKKKKKKGWGCCLHSSLWYISEKEGFRRFQKVLMPLPMQMCVYESAWICIKSLWKEMQQSSGSGFQWTGKLLAKRQGMEGDLVFTICFLYILNFQHVQILLI